MQVRLLCALQGASGACGRSSNADRLAERLDPERNILEGAPRVKLPFGSDGDLCAPGYPAV